MLLNIKHFLKTTKELLDSESRLRGDRNRQYRYKRKSDHTVCQVPRGDFPKSKVQKLKRAMEMPGEVIFIF